MPGSTPCSKFFFFAPSPLTQCYHRVLKHLSFITLCKYTIQSRFALVASVSGRAINCIFPHLSPIVVGHMYLFASVICNARQIKQYWFRGSDACMLYKEFQEFAQDCSCKIKGITVANDRCEFSRMTSSQSSQYFLMNDTNRLTVTRDSLGKRKSSF